MFLAHVRPNPCCVVVVGPTGKLVPAGDLPTWGAVAENAEEVQVPGAARHFVSFRSEACRWGLTPKAASKEFDPQCCLVDSSCVLLCGRQVGFSRLQDVSAGLDFLACFESVQQCLYADQRSVGLAVEAGPSCLELIYESFRVFTFGAARVAKHMQPYFSSGAYS